jgi:hypothetical protein
MSVPDPGLTGILACGLSAASLLVSAAVLVIGLRVIPPNPQTAVDPEVLALREALETHRAEYAGQLASLTRKLELLEAGSVGESGKRPHEALHDGRLNHSARAQALQLLRAGISPDTAANTLGTATRDIRLLAKVSRLLAMR